MGDSMGDDSGLAAPRPGQNQEGPVDVRDGFPLRAVQPIREPRRAGGLFVIPNLPDILSDIGGVGRFRVRIPGVAFVKKTRIHSLLYALSVIFRRNRYSFGTS